MNMRAVFRKIGKFLRSREVILTLLALLLAAFIWYAGPYIGVGEIYPLASVAVRLACLLVLALIWGVVGLMMRVRRSTEENALIAALRKRQEESEGAADKAQAALDAELARFKESARHAMSFMRRGRRSLFTNARYALPWYIVLGSTGAGKSSLLTDNGLSFVAAEAEAGDGATPAPALFRVTEEAVFVEISGEFLVSEDKSTQARLERVLDHLRAIRPRQPVNGVLVAIDMGELITQDAATCFQQGTLLRRRFDAISARLRAMAPIYLAVTKFDLVVGFEEFFETLSIEERAAPFGFEITGEASRNSSEAASVFEERFSAMLENLGGEQFVRLDEEPDELRRRRLAEFRSQFALVQQKLSSFLKALASPQRLGRPPYLRGLFFTSSEQPAEFRDGLVERMADRFAGRRDGLLFSGDVQLIRRHAFFLEGFFRKVLLPEAHLGGLTRPARAAMKGRDLAVNVMVLILTFGLFAMLWMAFSDGRDYAARLSGLVNSAQAGVGGAAAEETKPGRIEPVVATLDQFRALAQDESRGLGLGLYSVGAVHDASWEAYDRALANLFFPYVWGYLRAGLDAPQTPAALRFQQLKLYLMLTGERPVDAAATAEIAADFVDYWLPDSTAPGVDARVSAHLAELARVSAVKPVPNGPLVASARRMIANHTLARLGYDIVRAMPDVRDLSPWRPIDYMGLSGPEALGRASRASLWDGVAGLYTHAGMRAVRPAAQTAAEKIANDLWVMGADIDSGRRTRETGTIRDGILDLYRVDYIRQWDTLLADLGVAEVYTPDDVARAVAILIGTPSPLKELFAAIDMETRSSVQSAVVGQLAGSLLSQAGGVPANVPPGALPRRPLDIEQSISDHFRTFREAVTAAEGKPSLVDGTLAALEPLYGKLNNIATGGDALEIGAQSQSLLVALADKTRALPAILQPYFTRLNGRISGALSGSSRERLTEIWASTVLPACRAATEGRYPFDPKSADDATLQDFAQVFGPKGLIASFRSDYMKPFIDSTGKPWRWRKGPLDGPGFKPEVLGVLEMASDITDMYFGASETPKVQFMLKPAALDAKARAMQVDIGKSTLTYAHGPSGETAYQWPPEPASSPAAISMTPEIVGKRNTLMRQGNWALFRLFEAAEMLEKQPADVVSFKFDVGGRTAILQVMSSATRNPFAGNMLANFKCPVL